VRDQILQFLEYGFYSISYSFRITASAHIEGRKQMDKIKKTQIRLIVLGLFLTGAGSYLTVSFSTYYLVTAAVTITGLPIVRYGFRYKPQDKRDKTTIEKRTPKNNYSND